MVEMPSPELDTVSPLELLSTSLLNRKNFFIAINCYKYNKKEKGDRSPLSQRSNDY